MHRSCLLRSLFTGTLLSLPVGLPFAQTTTPDFDKDQILQRIQPIGSVSIEGETTTQDTNTKTAQVQPTVAKEPGQATYEQYCSVCHRDGVAGAPKFRSEDWKPRLDKQSITELVAVALKGLNAMPPKGTCSECTEDDLKNAIQYMLPRHD